ncbi:hypothetical protein BKA56DRAFT_243161 [Ilyonectria sp. MPI-CAGE-AT-0026]|nr:hypothetical protein BKA56DRAFT_243161 [Ilyonectria sp. MPI-CAGE-AT-0026]
MPVDKITATEKDLDDKLKEIAQARCSVNWYQHTDANEATPDDEIIALVVDIRKAKKAAVQIFLKDENGVEKYQDMVGQDYKRCLVIVPWDPAWSYFCVGSPRVGHASLVPNPK